MNLVGIAAHHITRHIIGHDPVHALAFALLAGVGDYVLRFRREADQQVGALRAGGQTGENIGVFGEDQRGRRAAAFLDLVGLVIARAPVGHRRHHDRHIAGQSRLHLARHIIGAFHIDPVNARRRAQVDRAGHQRHPRACIGGGGGDGVALFAA